MINVLFLVKVTVVLALVYLGHPYPGVIVALITWTVGKQKA
jgi:hypothetical protein